MGGHGGPHAAVDLTNGARPLPGIFTAAGPGPAGASDLRQRALVLALPQGAEEQRLVDATLEYRHTELHALRDYFAPVHASFSSELGGRQVDRHAFSSLSGNSPLCRSLSCTGCSGRRKLDSANSGCQNAEISAKQAIPSISDWIWNPDEALFDPEPLRHQFADATNPEGLRGVVAACDERDPGLLRLGHRRLRGLAADHRV